ncbi:MAG: fatty acid desaturase family protein [Myxococcales bacterium]|nr:fatty acid desaturase family protein [Myxococcales bacterium]MCB9706179.1 fatty acid desaturase family protein [Myxococcales bacterium]
MPAPSNTHPHDYDGEIPDRLPPAIVRQLSRLEPRRALRAIAVEWAAIIGAIALCKALGGGWLYPLTVIFIGARQHALVVLGHDAVHYRLLPNRRLNDWVANLLLWWPCAATNELFRAAHGAHHRYLGTERDGNIALWRLRGPDGRPTREWTYPKTPAQLAAKLLWRGCGLTGAVLVVVGLLRPLRRVGPIYGLVRLLVLGAIGGAFAAADRLDLLFYYWLVPLTTWFIASNYIRLICEHSMVRSDDPLYALTRTTLPSWFDLIFIVPRNISYHYEHHIYPSVPFYNLPALHAAMQRLPGYRAHAHVTRGIRRALAECLRR